MTTATATTVGELFAATVAEYEHEPALRTSDGVALVTLDPDAAASVDDPQAEVEAQIARANERLARVEQIKRFTVLPHEWLADGDELTPTSKLRRRAIAAKYANEIEGMYAGS
jgi:long-chain acyl-CoA synthetase